MEVRITVVIVGTGCPSLMFSAVWALAAVVGLGLGLPIRVAYSWLAKPHSR